MPPFVSALRCEPMMSFCADESNADGILIVGESRGTALESGDKKRFPPRPVEAPLRRDPKTPTSSPEAEHRGRARSVGAAVHRLCRKSSLASTMLQHGVNTALSLQEGTGRDALQAGGCLRQCHRRPGAMAPALCFAALQDSLAALHVETPLHVETGELQRTLSTKKASSCLGWRISHVDVLPAGDDMSDLSSYTRASIM